MHGDVTMPSIILHSQVTSEEAHVNTHTDISQSKHILKLCVYFVTHMVAIDSAIIIEQCCLGHPCVAVRRIKWVVVLRCVACIQNNSSTFGTNRDGHSREEVA